MASLGYCDQRCLRSGPLLQAVGFNEFGFENLTPEKAPVVVIVASSTGDGDPPDNAAKFLVTLK